MMLMFLLMLLTGCQEHGTVPVDELSGQYFYDECVYLNVFSSATKEYFSELHANVAFIDVRESLIEFQGTEQTRQTFADISFRNVALSKNFDDTINLDRDNLFGQYTHRYDVYQGPNYTGLSLFMSDDQIYLAEIRILGDCQDEYFIWTIFTLKKAA